MAVHQMPEPFFEEDEKPEPLETVASLIESLKWPMRREGEAVHFDITGGLAVYKVLYTWQPEESLMHFGLGFIQKVPKRRRSEYLKLIRRINDCIEFGHLERQEDDELTLYRSALPLLNRDITNEEVDFLLKRGIRIAETYHYFFDFVVTGMSADETFDKGQLLLIEENSVPAH